VFFTGDAAVGYAACLWLRTAIRVLRLVAVGDLRGPGRGGDRLYAFVRRAADWAALVPAGATLAVDARVNACTDLATSLLAGQMARNAVLDAVRDATGARPPPPEAGAQVDVPLFLAAHRDTAWLYRDMVGGGSLHRRGYRAGTAIHKAALNEAAAAVVLELAGWADAVEADASSLPVLADPMCGSGTLLIEAALMARRVAPGLARGKSGFPFVSWPDHDPAAWLAAGTAAKAAARPDAAPILLGNDAHAGALALAAAGAAAAGVDDCVSFTQGDAAAWRPRPRPELVVTNPPWGKRLDYGDDAGSGDAWPALGAFLRAAASPGQAYVVSGDPAATRGLRMKAAARTPLSFGGEEVRVLRYEVLPPREAGEGGGEA
jgi:23S rRNA G2445 N2-methylase RlmL